MSSCTGLGCSTPVENDSTISIGEFDLRGAHPMQSKGYAGIYTCGCAGWSGACSLTSVFGGRSGYIDTVSDNGATVVYNKAQRNKVANNHLANAIVSGKRVRYWNILLRSREARYMGQYTVHKLDENSVKLIRIEEVV